MRQERWRIVERLLDQVQGPAGRLVLAVAPQPLDVVLYEMPVFARTQPLHNPLRGFIQEAVSLLGEPTASDIAKLLHLPPVVVELVLGNLQQIGSVTSDVAGRWSVPQGAPVFRASGEDPPIWRRTRQLLCYWPERNVMLPVLPRLRLLDLVKLGVHRLQGEVTDWYVRCAAWSRDEGTRRGLPATVQLLPLSQLSPAEMGASVAPAAVADSPISSEDVLVSRCQLDVIVLTWASQRCGVWEVASRIWSRPTPPDDSDGELFSPGEPVVGLSLPEHLLRGENRLDELGKLFDPQPERWRSLLSEQNKQFKLYRELDGDGPSVIVTKSDDSQQKVRWLGLFTHFAPDARLLCASAPATRSANDVRQSDERG